jgi:hypothetical protein
MPSPLDSHTCSQNLLPPFYVTIFGVPDLEIYQKIMKYAKRYKMATLYLY